MAPIGCVTTAAVRCMPAKGDMDSWKEEKCWVPVAELCPTYAASAAAAGDRHPFPKGPLKNGYANWVLKNSG